MTLKDIKIKREKMTKECLKKYNIYLSYEDTLNKLLHEVEGIVPYQIWECDSETRHMTRELKKLREDLLFIINKNKEMIQTKKEEL